MRVSKFSDMIPAVVTLAVFTGALVLFPGKGLFVYPVPAYIVFALCECMALLNVWALGKYYVLTDQGIEHKFLGIRYRTTQWDEIGDVMRSRCAMPTRSCRMCRRVMAGWTMTALRRRRTERSSRENLACISDHLLIQFSGSQNMPKSENKAGCVVYAAQPALCFSIIRSAER